MNVLLLFLGHLRLPVATDLVGFLHLSWVLSDVLAQISEDAVAKRIIRGGLAPADYWQGLVAAAWLRVSARSGWII